ncbi:MAG: helix-turn-helix domain-containing protein [Ruminococcus sp.]|nr:helix-turn-helix domain-containing protein [Ruminococcus sp.]
MNQFGNLLKLLRNKTGMSQEEFAEKMDVSKNTVQNWESGRTKVSEKHLDKLALLLNISKMTLISEMSMDEKIRSKDIFPYFLFDDEQISIIKTLHLNLEQQELFGLIYLYSPDSISELYLNYVFNDAITKIPSEYICRTGSIKFLCLADELAKVLRYVDAEFLMKVLKLYPNEEFDVCRLPKELICQFINEGYVHYHDIDESELGVKVIALPYSLNYAKSLLPLIEEYEPLHLYDMASHDFTLSNDLPDKFIETMEEIHGKHWIHCMTFELIDRIEKNSESGVKEYYIQLNETGKKLLKWFREKE